MTRTLMLLLGVLAATAVPAQAAPIEFLPIGTWQGQVTAGQDPPHEATFQFTGAGKVCLTFGRPGEASGSGTGTWHRAGPNQFTYALTHDVNLPDGTLVAYVTVHHTASQHRDRFTSFGRTDVTDPDGKPVKTVQSSVIATRTGQTHPACE
ncbi:hypothetical protein [Nocardia sp. NPDC052566]|uniref:hypothetical protein n=1 Tax=Nocardia sp. NPDC052566 TaxID=3364330 RepID=UPI0037C93846